MDEKSEPTLEEKEKYIEELLKLTEIADERIKELCSRFGFDYDDVNKEREPFVTCPFDSGHLMPERSLLKHLEKCEWNKLGYTKDCKPLPESALPLESPSTIKFDMELQHKILQEAKAKNPELNIGNEEKLIPMTSDRLMSDFTIDERRVMYDYIIANTVAPDCGKDITDIDNIKKKEDNKNSTILELLQQERNLKRRRAKYRGVHTNKKTHTEILREIVEQQMEMYKEYVVEKYGISALEDKKSSFSNNSRNEQKSNETKYHDKSDEFSSKHRNYDDSDNDYKNKSKWNSKDFNDRYSDKNSKRLYDKSYSHKSSSHYKDNDRDRENDSSRSHDSSHSQKSLDQRNTNRECYDKHRSRDRKRDKDDYRNENDDDHDKSYNHKHSSKDRSRSKKRKRSKSDERGQNEKNEKSKDDYKRRSRSRSEERKRDDKRKRSRSRETKHDKRDDRKSHKKHKKERKKERNRSNDNNHDDSNNSKQDSKRRSRSWS